MMAPYSCVTAGVDCIRLGPHRGWQLAFVWSPAIQDGYSPEATDSISLLVITGHSENVVLEFCLRTSIARRFLTKGERNPEKRAEKVKHHLQLSL